MRLKDKIKDLVEYDLEMVSAVSEAEKLAFIKELLEFKYERTPIVDIEAKHEELDL
jgi:hypothetical protein